MITSFGPVLLQIFVAGAVTLLILFLSHWIGPKIQNKVKGDTFECGVKYFQDARGGINIKFYLVAVIFLLFDIEVIFFIPWAVSLSFFKGSVLAILIFLEMLIFIGILILAYIYIIKKGVLEWE